MGEEGVFMGEEGDFHGGGGGFLVHAETVDLLFTSTNLRAWR